MFKTPVAALAVLATTTLTPAAETATIPGTGPSDTDLLVHLECSETALHRLLSFDEARQCGRAFQRVKLSFVPGVDLAAYNALSPEARAAANLTGYQRYVGWSELNAAKLDLLRDRVRAVRALAAD